jgi:hypothetical protein
VRDRVRAQNQSAPDTEQCLSDGTRRQILQRSTAPEPQRLGDVAGAPDCLVHPSTAAIPNHHHSKHPRFSYNTRASAFTPRHKSKESKPLQVSNPLQPLSDLRESFCSCSLCSCCLDRFLPSSFLFPSEL